MALTADMGNVTISSVFRAEMVTKRGTNRKTEELSGCVEHISGVEWRRIQD